MASWRLALPGNFETPGSVTLAIPPNDPKPGRRRYADRLRRPDLRGDWCYARSLQSV